MGSGLSGNETADSSAVVTMTETITGKNFE